ncbi:MAG TPA: putative lipid II flippase FtsW [bacterium]|nr:putative lipid II flippase FtsW [bacterium]HPT29966.1 putative lipid II flippase FtsW [bacterium]
MTWRGGALAHPKTEQLADKKLVITIIGLLVFGLVMLFSASLVAGYVKGGSSLYFIKHQLFGLALGLPAMIILSKINYHYLKPWALYALIGSFLLLSLVFIPGLGAGYGKAQNWINVFGFSVQPSEFVKLLFLIYLAAWLEVKADRINSFKDSLGPLVFIIAAISILMLKQPDLGTLSIILGSSLIVYFVAGIKWRYIAAILVIAAMALLILLNQKSNKMDRIECFQHPEINAGEQCYQINQSLIAIGSGGFLGRGLGESRQKFMYLPEVWSDSIFAVIAEEVGFLFSLALIAAYFFLAYRGLMIASRAPDLFGRYLAVGISAWVVVQAILNIGGAMNFIPMTGVPLPFVSSGGSALLALLAAMGILINISRQTVKS